LENVLKKVQQVADFVNEKKRESDNMAKMNDIQSKLEDHKKFVLLQPGRFFVREGVLQLLDANAKNSKERYFILLSDVLLCLTISGSKYAIKYTYDLSEYSVMPHASPPDHVFEVIRMVPLNSQNHTPFSDEKKQNSIAGYR